jgi:hypothetical protein
MEAAIRVGISKKNRFDVFKRDGFKCQYCSSQPPTVILEVDHIMPVSKGGKNNIDNLITACFNCNRGKSNKELTSIPKSLKEKSENLKIAKEQYLMLQKAIKQNQDVISKGIDLVESIYTSSFDNWCFTDKFRLSVENFINRLGLLEVIDSMKKAVARIYDADKVLGYFCAICWNKIKDK